MLADFDRFIEFVIDDKPTLRAAEYLRELTRQVNLNETLIGVGSPEGVVEAPTTQKYMNTAGTAGNILYIKRTGIGNTGWILV